jgi:filamentous hemagglutinin family protein
MGYRTPQASLAQLAKALRHVRLYRIAVTLICAATTGSVLAQRPTSIKIDASWSRTPQTLSPSASATSITSNLGAKLDVPGKLYIVPQELGRKAGSNLFHSFESFLVGTGDAAVFTTRDSLSNVISRVTGATPSMINGILSLQPAAGSAPNFFFINPNGVVFGAGAQVDMPGAFHVSTANYLRFADDTVFAAGRADSALTTAPPEAFGFLGTTRASVTVNEGAVLYPFLFAPLSVVAGDVEVNQASLFAFACGDLRIAAVGHDAIEVPITGPLPIAHGLLSAVDGAVIQTQSLTGFDSGRLQISAGDITLGSRPAGAGLVVLGTVANAKHDASAGDITINAANSLSILAGASVETISLSRNTGNVAVTADEIHIAGDSVSPFTGIIAQADKGSTGRAGNLNITATTLLSLQDGGQIGSGTLASGDTGNVTVVAGKLDMNGGFAKFPTGIFDSSQATATGQAGSVDVTVLGDLRMMSGGTISATTFGKGNGGTVKVRADNIFIDNGAHRPFTGIASSASKSSEGNAGTVEVAVTGNLTMLHTTDIQSATFSKGDAGSVKVSAGSITLDDDALIFSNSNRGATGKAGKVNIFVRADASLLNSSEIGAHTFSRDPQGTGGDVNVTVGGRLLVRNNALITASTLGAADAGSVHVAAQSIVIDGEDNSSLFTGVTAFADGTLGNAGEVRVSATGELSIIRAGGIFADTSSAGRSGSIAVTAGMLRMDGAFTAIQAGAMEGSSGQTGTLTIQAARSITLSNGAELSIRNDAFVEHPDLISPTQLTVSAPTITLRDAQITAQSSGNVAASNIDVHFTDRLLIDPSQISTASLLGNGGAIVIAGTGPAVLDRSRIATSALLSGNGGDISINAPVLVMNTGFIQANTGGTGAHGGNVTVNVQALISTGGSVIQAAAPSGVKGVINVTGPLLDIAGTLRGLSTEVAEAVKLNRDLCRMGAHSSLTPVGRGGLRPVASGPIRPESGFVLTAQRKDPRKLLSATADISYQSQSRCDY